MKLKENKLHGPILKCELFQQQLKIMNFPYLVATALW
jgi:hypothetical protein